MSTNPDDITPTQLRRNPTLRRVRPTADRIAAARALYEGTPGATLAWVANEVGMPKSTLKDWAVKQDWRPAIKRLPDLAGRAGDLANSFKVKMSELGRPLDDEVAAAEASRELADAYAIDVRAEVLDRHRKEWAAPRKLAYEAVSKRDFELAKLAKITSETLTLVQGGECRAYGINHDARAADAKTVILVDRSAPEAETVEPVSAPAVEASSETATPSDSADLDGEEF